MFMYILYIHFETCFLHLCGAARRAAGGARSWLLASFASCGLDRIKRKRSGRAPQGPERQHHVTSAAREPAPTPEHDHTRERTDTHKSTPRPEHASARARTESEPLQEEAMRSLLDAFTSHATSRHGVRGQAMKEAKCTRRARALAHVVSATAVLLLLLLLLLLLPVLLLLLLLLPALPAAAAAAALLPAASPAAAAAAAACRVLRSGL